MEGSSHNTIMLPLLHACRPPWELRTICFWWGLFKLSAGCLRLFIGWALSEWLCNHFLCNHFLARSEPAHLEMGSQLQTTNWDHPWIPSDCAVGCPASFIKDVVCLLYAAISSPHLLLSPIPLSQFWTCFLLDYRPFFSWHFMMSTAFCISGWLLDAALKDAACCMLPFPPPSPFHHSSPILWFCFVFITNFTHFLS